MAHCHVKKSYNLDHVPRLINQFQLPLLVSLLIRQKCTSKKVCYLRCSFTRERWGLYCNTVLTDISCTSLRDDHVNPFLGSPCFVLSARNSQYQTIPILHIIHINIQHKHQVVSSSIELAVEKILSYPILSPDLGAGRSMVVETGTVPSPSRQPISYEGSWTCTSSLIQSTLIPSVSISKVESCK